MPKLPRDLKPRRAIKILEDHGFILINQKGSHRTYHQPDEKIVVTLVDHGQLRVGTLRELRRISRIPLENWTKK